jgi:hypothetical protein
MTTTTFLSFTPRGGRIGRIAWSNGDDNTWGHICWDHWWPQQRPTRTLIDKAVEQIQKNVLAFTQALYPAVERASDAILALGAALGKAQAEAGETHETQDEASP